MSDESLRSKSADDLAPVARARGGALERTILHLADLKEVVERAREIDARLVKVRQSDFEEPDAGAARADGQ